MIEYRDIRKRQNRKRKNILLLVVAALLATVIVNTSTLSLSSYNHAKAITQLQNNNRLSLRSLVQQGSPLLGKASAPITIVEFGDFQCDRCARFAKYTEPQINQTYIQTGKVNLVFKYFPNYGPDSPPAAMAAQCANDQGKFWNYYGILFKNQGPPNFGWASKDNLQKFASQIPGIDMQKFTSCLGSQKYLSFVQSDLALATSLGLQGTPTFVIEKTDGSGSQTLPGAYPFTSFKAIIDKDLGSG